MTNHISLKDILERELKDNEFKDLYKKEQIKNAIAKMVVTMRQKAHLTQQELADRAHTTQQVISRLEKGSDSSRMPSLDLLCRLAEAANGEIDISFKIRKSL